MVKHVVILFSCCVLGACAGNPPAWWNPSGTYSTSQPAQQAAPAADPSLAAPASAEEEEPYPAEQTIEPVMQSYEELDLSPFAQTVEVSASAEAEPAAAPAPSAAPAAEPSAQLPDAPAAPAPEEEEALPADGSLPPPSVLQ